VVHTGQCRNAYRVSVGKPERKILFRRLGQRWDDNIKMDKWQVLVNMVINLQVPQNAKTFLNSRLRNHQLVKNSALWR
jgi:hypothetical protein